MKVIVAIIVSKKDPAGLNIKERLLELFNFKETDELFENNKVYQYNNIKLYTTEKESIDCNYVDKEIGCEQIIFATKHRSIEGRNSLSCHAPGNWSKAEVGGFEKKLSVVKKQLK